MKCCHLLAAVMLAACGLDTGALPATDAGVAAHGGGIAGAPATWPTRRRLTPIAKDPAKQVPADKDGGATDPKDPANKPGGKQPSAGGASGAGGPAKPTGQAGGAAANPGGVSNPNGQVTPGGQTPSNSGKGGQAKPSGQAGSGTSQPSGGNNGSQSSADAGTGMSSNPGSNNGSQGPGSNGNSGNGGQGPASGPGSNGHGNGPQSSSPVDNTISGIVDLVLAILDLSLGPVRPIEIEQLVSAILVLSLAPAELAADSLIAVLDALDGTHICQDHPERCNPLCENLESDCSVCGKDEDCIDRVEEMCHVKLPRRCH